MAGLEPLTTTALAAQQGPPATASALLNVPSRCRGSRNGTRPARASATANHCTPRRRWPRDAHASSSSRRIVYEHGGLARAAALERRHQQADEAAGLQQPDGDRPGERRRPQRAPQHEEEGEQAERAEGGPEGGEGERLRVLQPIFMATES